jgi:hypothetical protein
MDFNIRRAAEDLICNKTCLHCISVIKNEGRENQRVYCRVQSSVGEGSTRPKSGTCPFHSLKGYTGDGFKLSNYMLYAEDYAKKQAETMKRTESKEK